MVLADKRSMTSGSRTMSGSTGTASSSRHLSSCGICEPCTDEQFNSTTKPRMTDKMDSLCELDRCPSSASSCHCSYQYMKRERIRQRWRRKLVVGRSRKHQSSCSVVIIVGASVVVVAAIGLCAMATSLELTPSAINILWLKNLERIRRWNLNNVDTSKQTPSSTSTLNFPRSGNGFPGQEPSLGSRRIRNGDDMRGEQEGTGTIALNSKDIHGQRTSNSGRLDLQVADLSELGGDELGASMSKGDSIIHQDQLGGAIPITRSERAPVASGGTSIARYATSSKLPRIRRRSLKSSKSSKGSHTKSYAKKSTNKYRQSKQSKGGGAGSSISSQSHGNTSKGYSNQRRRPRPSESSDSKSSRSSSSGEDGDWRTTLDKLRARADETEGTDDQGAASTEEEDFISSFLWRRIICRACRLTPQLLSRRRRILQRSSRRQNRVTLILSLRLLLPSQQWLQMNQPFLCNQPLPRLNQQHCRPLLTQPSILQEGEFLYPKEHVFIDLHVCIGMIWYQQLSVTIIVPFAAFFFYLRQPHI